MRNVTADSAPKKKHVEGRIAKMGERISVESRMEI